MATSLVKRLFTHGAVYTVSRLANQGIGIILLPLYARLLGPDGYGVVSLLAAVGAFLGLVWSQGLQGSWFRLRFECRDHRELRIFESTIIWYLVASVAVGLGVLAICGDGLARICTPGVPYYPLGLLTAIAAAATIFPSLYERQLQVTQKPIRFAIFSFSRTAFTLGSIVLLVAGFGRGLRGKLEADAITAILGAIAAFALLKPGGPQLVSKASLRRSLGYGWPLVPHHLAALANNLIDRGLLNALLGTSAVGVYSAGYQIASIGLVFAMALNQAFTPLFIAAMKEKEAAKARGDTNTVQKSLASVAHASLLTIATVACLLIGITAVAREILYLLMTDRFADSWTVVALVSAGTLAWATYFPFAQAVFYDIKRARYISVVTISAAIVNVVGNWFLIPRFGIMGAAWATLISNSIMAVVAMVLGQKTTPLPHRWSQWMGVMLCACGAFAGLWLLDAFSLEPALRIAFKAGLAGASIWVICRVANVRWSDVRSLLPVAKG